MRTFPTFITPPEPQDKPTAALNAARAAASEGRHAEALERYEWFFDHALDDDPASYYGVRLSYCLGEWFQLGIQYPPAKTRLEARRDEALELLASTRQPERFHDYIAICQALDAESRLPAEMFADLHARDPALAASLVRYIWNELIDARMWDIAGTYVTDYRADYEEAVIKFEQTMQVFDENPQLGGEEMGDTVRAWCVTDLRNLWLVLKHSNRSTEAHELEQLASSDERLRKHAAITERAFAAE